MTVPTITDYEEAIATIKAKYVETLPVYQGAQALLANGVRNEQIVINTTVTETLAWALSLFETKKEPETPTG